MALYNVVYMNERMRELALQATVDKTDEFGHWIGNEFDPEKFAELIVAECTGLLFDESERLYAYSSECDNMRESDEAEVVAEKCVDMITMIEQHFGVDRHR